MIPPPLLLAPDPVTIDCPLGVFRKNGGTEIKPWNLIWIMPA